MEPWRTGNYRQKVSCWCETQWSHVGQETACEKFPVEMKRSAVMSDRKLFAKGFLLRRNTMELWRIGNCMQKVSCWCETQWSHVGQETACERFPTEVKHSKAMPSRKPFAKGFLLRWNTMELCRIGNCMQKVSCWCETQWSDGGQETVCKRFPTEAKHNGAMTDRKLYAKSFLLVWNTMEPCRTGNCLRKVSYWGETQ